jgi:benzodiazapine receptor
VNDFRSALLKGGNVAAFAVTLLVNSLAGVGIIGGKSTGAISDLYKTLVTPAGYVFSIWGVIYVLLGVFVMFQLLPSQIDRAFHQQVGVLFVLSCVFNVLWIFLWQYEFIVASVPLILGLLVSLIWAYGRLNVGKSLVSLREKLAVHLPFSVYFGWITVASIADIAAAFVSVGWDGFGISDVSWAIVFLAVALVVTLVVVLWRRDVAYGLVVIWALAGIGVSQNAYQDIVTVVEVGIAIIVVAVVAAILISWLRRRNR